MFIRVGKGGSMYNSLWSQDRLTCQKMQRERESNLTYFDHPNKNIDRDLRITRILVK